MKGRPTLVHPGGPTTCLRGGDYAFAVVPRSADKLLILFEGGGACWEANGANGRQVVLNCTDNLASAVAISGLGSGVQDYANMRNPFKDYSVVEVLYCSGDGHIGNTELVDGNATYRQAGLHNAAAALRWAFENFKCAHLSSLVVMGASAGAGGIVSWADKILKSCGGYRHARVILDSYAGVFPGNTESATIRSWTGGCRIPILDAALVAQCLQGRLTAGAIWEFAMARHPDVAFASIESKTDQVQIEFYQAFAWSFGLVAEVGIMPAEFYKQANVIFEHYTRHPNYVLYLVNGQQHVFVASPEFYTASTAGPEAGKEGRGPMLYEWVGELLVWWRHVASQCDGPLLANKASNGETFCDAKLLPKSLMLSR